MRHLLRSLVVLALLIAAGPASANPPAWSWERVAAGVDAQGAIMTNTAGERSAFLPGAFVTYSATSAMALAATVQRDFAGEQTFARGGIRFLLAGYDRFQLGAGADLIAYDGVEGLTDETSWEVGLFGSYPVVQNLEGRTQVWGVISARFDPENERQTYLIGLRWRML